MELDIYTSTKNWKFTQLDHLAQQKFTKIQQETRSSLPESFYHHQTICHLDFMTSSPLYPLLQSLPKGVLHHLHFICCEDVEFYRLYVINDPKIWLTGDKKLLAIGTKQEAEKQSWISMEEERKNHGSELEMAKFVSSITMLHAEELKEMSFEQKQMWDRFEQKIGKLIPLLLCLDIFKKYAKHMMLKFIKNGYDRIEFRALASRLKQYDSEGNFIKQHQEKTYMDAIDEVYEEVRKEYPHFTVGFIFFGMKVFKPEHNEQLFDTVCKLDWDKTIGFDFVQQQDAFGPLQSYDSIVDKVVERYPHLNYKKVYHAGQTKDHRTRNLDVAVKSGSVRIGHGFNILQRMEFLPHCKNICFQKNPLSNLFLGYNQDAREGSAPVLLGLGYAVSISPDDPGKFGVEDTTVDYFLAAISYNWTLRDLKLIAYHSINHAVCDEHTKKVCLRQFERKWDNWVVNFVGKETVKNQHRWHQPDIFSNVRGWSWSEKEQNAMAKFNEIKEKTIDSLPEDFYKQKVLSHLRFIKNEHLYRLFKTIPKGSLHHCHFDCNEDAQFYKEYVITDPRIYLSPDKKQFRIGTKQQAEKEGWLSWQTLRQTYKPDANLADYLYSLTSFTHEQMLESAGIPQKFWPSFEQKITTFNYLLGTKDIFLNYCRHILHKYVKNGYQRIQFRALLTGLKQYDKQGNLVKEHDERMFAECFDQVYEEVKKEYPSLTVGFIFFGLLGWSQEDNYNMLKKVMNLNWNLTVGIDFVQEQDPHGSLEPYDKIADKILAEFPDQNVKKCYHAGDTRNHKNNNIKIALKAGSVRIGHGLNILQHTEIIPRCNKTCFELCPVSNVITASSARMDLRLSTAPILLGLGVPVSINPDDPGKFGCQDSTVDYFCAGLAFNWSLKHFKLIALHSINYSLCSEGQKILLAQQFNSKWEQWLNSVLLLS